MTSGRLMGPGLAGWAALAVVLAVLGRPTPFLVSVGFVVAAAGEAIRLWAAGYRAEPPELLTAGPYRHSRHPLFLGRLLIFTGFVLMAPLPKGATWVLLLAGWAFLVGFVLRRKDRAESATFRDRFGEAYERYRREVPGLVPRIRPYESVGTAAGWSSDRLTRSREPWVLVVVVAFTLLLLWKAYRPQATSPEPPSETVVPAATYFGESSNWSA